MNAANPKQTLVLDTNIIQRHDNLAELSTKYELVTANLVMDEIKDIELQAGKTEEWNPVFETGSRIFGLLVDEKGEPLANWTVNGRNKDRNSQTWRQRTETGADGRTRIEFRYPGIFVTPGSRIDVRLSLQGVLTKAPEHTLANPVFTRESIPAWKLLAGNCQSFLDGTSAK